MAEPRAAKVQTTQLPVPNSDFYQLGMRTERKLATLSALSSGSYRIENARQSETLFRLVGYLLLSWWLKWEMREQRVIPIVAET